MPIRVLPVPSIPPGTCLVKAMHIRGLTGTHWVADSYYNHWFIASPSSAPTFSIATAIVNCRDLWFRPFYSGQCPTNMGQCDMQIFANVRGYVQSSVTAFAPPPPLAGDCISPMLKVRFRRAYESLTSPIIGRCSFLPVIRAYLDGDYVNPAGKGFYDACLTQYMQTWTSQGVTFTPAIYSQKFNIVRPLTSVNVIHKPGMDRKSRWKDEAHSYVYVWPSVGP
jgi:hypothetical protein